MPLQGPVSHYLHKSCNLASNLSSIIECTPPSPPLMEICLRSGMAGGDNLSLARSLAGVAIERASRASTIAT
eukprot:4786225-Pleurochrysis_carterae.AAC.4